MKKNLPEIDQLFKDALGQKEDAPHSSVWDAIDRKLDQHKVVNIQRKYVRIKRLALALTILLCISGVYTVKNWGNINRQTAGKLPAKFPAAEKIKKPLHSAAIAKETNSNRLVENGANSNAALVREENTTATTAITKSMESLAAKKQSLPDDTILDQPKTTRHESNVVSDNALKNENVASSKKSNPLKNKNEVEDFAGNKMIFLNETGGHPDYKKQTLADKSLSNNLMLIASPSLMPFGQDFYKKINTPVQDQSPKYLSINNSKPVRKVRQRVVHAIDLTAFTGPDMAYNRMEDNDDHRQPMPVENRDRLRHEEKEQISIQYGLLASYHINNRWAFQTGFNVVNKSTGIQPKIIYALLDNSGAVKYLYNCSSGYTFISSKVVANPVVGDSLKAAHSTNRLQYFQIPLAVKYSFAVNHIGFFASAGTALNILSKGSIQTETGQGTNKEMHTITKLQGLQPVYLGGVVSAGAYYRFSKKFSFTVMPAYNFALTAATSNAPVKIYPKSVSLNAGITYRL